jgi:hypothetical protein
MTTFEEYLREIHAEDYSGTDDDMPDAYEDWVSNLDAQEMFEYAEEALKECLAQK